MTLRSAGAAESIMMTKDAIVLDRLRLRELTDGDAEFERELLETFADSARSLLADLRASLMARNAAAVATDAHALKGVCLNIGAISMARCAAELEEAARAGVADPADVALEQLRSEERALWAELAA
jgi:HPt (histidine-containing phosphotransfer) domain-containing protein